MSDVELTDYEREALVGAITAAVNYQSFDAKVGQSDLSMAEEIVYITSAATAPGGLIAAVGRIFAARLSQEREQVRAEGAAIVESFRRPNPMNGDGSNYTIDLILATLVGPEERDRLKREHQYKWDAEYLAMRDRLAAQDGPRPAQEGEQ